SSSKPHDESSTKVPEGSENPNPTASSSNLLADQIDTLTVESPIPTDSSPVPTACLNDSPEPSSEARLISKRVANQEETPSLDNILSLTNRFEDILGVTTSSDEAIGVEDDVSNMETTVSAGPTPTLRIHKDHPKSQIIGPMDTPIQTRHKSKEVEEQSFIATICLKTDPALLQFFLFSCFLSQVEPKKVSGVRPIGTKWVLKNKKDKRGIVVRNEARLVAQGHTQEEGIDCDEVFAPVARIKAIRLFLAYASFIGFTVYQMDVKSAFLYGTIDVRSSNTPMDKENPWGKDGTEKDVDLHLYRSMIGSLMYLNASRPDLMFAGHPKLGLWYSKESPFDLVAYSDSDYGGASQDHKSTTGGSQFLVEKVVGVMGKWWSWTGMEGVSGKVAGRKFRINPSKTSRKEKHVPNTVSASIRTKPITVSQPHVITKKDVNSDLNGLSSTGVDNTKTRRPQPRSNTKHDRVPSASKSSQSKNKEAKVEEHHRNLLLSKNNKHISSA
nr:hypothetical protein [Tanacetum cinerariifolium]